MNNVEVVGSEPARYPVGEFTWEELMSSSGIFDDSIGRYLTNFEAIDFLEGVLASAQGIYTDNNGGLSQEAREYNDTLKANNERNRDKYKVLIWSRRPPEA